MRYKLMTIDEKFKELHRLISGFNNFVLISHVHTDGDALGSMIAFHFYLQQLHKKSTIIVPGMIPDKFHFLGTKTLINNYTVEQNKAKIANADMIIIFDISALDRLEFWFDSVYASPAYKVCIDHHPLNPQWLDMDIVDTKRVATGEMIYRFLEINDIKVDKVMAEAIYTAILADSGSFRFQQTNEETFRIAGRMVGLGADPVLMYSRVFENGHHSQLQAWGVLLSEVQYQDEILWLTVTRKFLDEHNLALEDIDGIVDIMRKDKNAGVFAVFVEKENRVILVGLRSKNEVDVGKVAQALGGGGHFHAAGFTSSKLLNETVRETLALLEEERQHLESVA